jgi:hypothetical protein
MSTNINYKIGIEILMYNLINKIYFLFKKSFNKQSNEYYMEFIKIS